MSSAVVEQVFSVPFGHLLSTNFAGEQSVCSATSTHCMTGLKRFVGDQSNALLQFLTPDSINQHFNNDHHWPLVLFGSPGTGKTSLAMTIISNLADQRFENTDPDSATKPIFLSAPDFDRRYRSALETDSITDFRNRLIFSSGLVIDDLHKLSNKIAAQNEFIHILDEMCIRNIPIVITLNSQPLSNDGLLPSLTSRLSGGLNLPVHPPGRDARREIVIDLANMHQLFLTDDAVNLLVDRLHVTVPKLNHFFAQIKTALLSDESLDPRQSIDALQLTRLFQKNDDDIEKLSRLIIKKVAAFQNLKISEIKSNSRKQSIVFARALAIYLQRSLLGISFHKIGSYFGNRDHSTIIHAYRKIESQLNGRQSTDNSPTKTVVNKLSQTISEEFASLINFA